MDLSTQIEARGATYRFAGNDAPGYRAVVDVWGGWRDETPTGPAERG